MRRSFGRIATVSLVIVLVSVAGYRAVAALGQAAPQATAPTGISPAGLTQINALLAEKRALTPTQRKINSRLLHAKRQLTRETSVMTVNITLPRSASGKVQLELRAEITDRLLAALRALGIDIVATQASGRSVLVDADLLQIEQIAALPDVHYVQPKPGYMTSVSRDSLSGPPPVRSPDDLRGRREQKARDRRAIVASVRAALERQGSVTNTGSTTSQGDATHKAAAARATYGIDGTGVNVGVISDGVASLAQSQASGDLGPVTVLPLQEGMGDEGTAMLEIIHDLAPGAQLFFATADPTPAQFAQNIRDLRTAGCDIIVDDVLYFVESPFQDGQDPGVISEFNSGVIAQAVKDVTAAGALYFSSAANSGNKDGNTSGTWEGDFVDIGASPGAIQAFEGQPTRLHSFGSTGYNVVTATTGPVSLMWTDPLGASANDYDLFILDATGTIVEDLSFEAQTGTQDPIEMTGQALTGERIVIVQFSGERRFLHLDSNRGRLTVSTPGSTHGHADTTSLTSFSVAATPAATPFTLGAPAGPFPNPFNATNVVEPFSSDGPRRIFFTSTGAAITPGDLSVTGGQILQKPDITAADGVLVSGAGGFSSPFFGTSAAAPHAGAIAALVKSADLTLTSGQIRSALLKGAIDIQAPGIDRDSGAGIVMADTAIAAVARPAIPTAPTITVQPQSQTIAPGTTALLTVLAPANPTPTYQWHQGPTGTLNPIPGATAGSFTTPPLSTPTKYWVRVSNGGGTVDSTTALVSVFSDPALTTTLTLVRASHILQLRARIDALRSARLGLAAWPWTDATLTPATTTIKAVDLTDLRAAVIDLANQLGQPAPTFTGAISAGTLIKAQHLTELRTAVSALE